MCFDADSEPPIPPLGGGAYASGRLELVGTDGNRFAAFEARAGDVPTRAAMLILPDVRGLYTFYEELALRFAEAGIDALAIDYFGRTAGTAPRDARFDFGAHSEQTTWTGLRADIETGARRLAGAAGPREGGRSLFSVGFCFGGRLSYLCSTLREPAFAGVIGFYGWPSGPSRGGSPAPADLVADIGCPVLGFFGGADQGIPVSAAEAFRTTLEAAGVPHEIVIYPDAPHSFFDRKQAEFQTESDDAWGRTLAFVRANAGA